jgi:hypothetical protein
MLKRRVGCTRRPRMHVQCNRHVQLLGERVERLHARVVRPNAFVLGADFANYLEPPGGMLAAQQCQIHLRGIKNCVADDNLLRRDLLPAQLRFAITAADHRFHHIEALHGSKGRRLVVRCVSRSD